MKILSFILLFTVFLAQDCKNRKNTESIPEMNSTEVIPVLKLMTNACFGKCPMYALTLYNNGKAEYVGRANVDKMGTFTKQIPTEDVANLIKKFNEAKFWEMDDRYISDLSDTQKILITQFRNDKSKTVTGDHVRPESLKNLQKLMELIANNKEGWTKTKDHPTEKEDRAPSYLIKNEIIVKFDKGTDVEASVATKKQFGISIKKRVAPNLDMYVLTYDTIRINPERMISHVKKMPGVNTAEFNKQLKTREH